MKRLFAEHAWLGPGEFAERVLVDFDTHIRDVRELTANENPPADAERVHLLTPGFINAHCHLEYSWLHGIKPADGEKPAGSNVRNSPLGSAGVSPAKAALADCNTGRADNPAFETDSKLHPALPRGSVPFGEWMQAIIAARPTTARDWARRADAMQVAAQALIHGGCTAVIDSTTDGSSAAPLSNAGLRFFLFHEVLGLSQQRAQPMLERALAQIREQPIDIKRADGVKSADPKLSETPPGSAGVSPAQSASADFQTDKNVHPVFPAVSALHLLGQGLNPHALYSVGPWLREQLQRMELAAIPQAWHLGETPDEEELFRTGAGSIAEFLKANELPTPWDEGQPSMSPLGSAFEHLRGEGQLERCVLAFHGNTLSLDQAKFFTAPRALVHCPGTHRWFARPPAPVKEWLEAGVNVCLGTDSLASSVSLSMLAMIRHVISDNADISADDALTMACRNPCRISILKPKGPSGNIGRSEPADMVALKVQEFVGWRSALADPATLVSSTWIAGQRV